MTTEQLHNIGRLLSSDEPANVELGKQLLKGAGRFDCETIDACCDYEGFPKRYSSPLMLDNEIWILYYNKALMEQDAAKNKLMKSIEEADVLISECKELRCQIAMRKNGELGITLCNMENVTFGDRLPPR